MPVFGIGVIGNPDIVSDTVDISRLGQNIVYGVAVSQVKSGLQYVRTLLISNKIASNSIAAPAIFVGEKRGLVAIGGAVFFGEKIGGNYVLNSRSGSKIGKNGVQVQGLNGRKGFNYVYNGFGINGVEGKNSIGSGPAMTVYTGDKIGLNRIANDSIAGYIAFVGVGALPDLSGPETAFSSTLPFTLAHALPGTGSQELFIVLRKRNAYGLVSQNQKATQIKLISSGSMLDDIPTPTGSRLALQSGNIINVLSSYSSYLSDQNPADQWAIWFSNTDFPNTSQPPILVPVRGQYLIYQAGTSLGSGTWYFTLALYRSEDGAYSPQVNLSGLLPFPPPCVEPVGSQYQLPCDCSTESPEPMGLAYSSTLDGLSMCSGAPGRLAFYGTIIVTPPLTALVDRDGLSVVDRDSVQLVGS